MAFNRTDGSDGGDAFPRHYQDDIPGMSLRDYFAAKALSSITANDFALNNYIPQQIAEWAYQMADAMLAERAK